MSFHIIIPKIATMTAPIMAKCSRFLLSLWIIGRIVLLHWMTSSAFNSLAFTVNNSCFKWVTSAFSCLFSWWQNFYAPSTTSCFASDSHVQCIDNFENSQRCNTSVRSINILFHSFWIISCSITSWFNAVTAIFHLNQLAIARPMAAPTIVFPRMIG